MHISIAAEPIFYIFGIAITNTVITAVLISILLITFIVIFNKKISYENPGKTQILLEMAIDYMGEMVFNLLGKRRGQKVLGFLFTFLLIILTSNWFGLLPIVPTIGVIKDPIESVHEITFMECIQNRKCYLTVNGIQEVEHKIHLLRAPTTDLSMTIALALLAVVSINFAGLKALRLGYIKKFVDFSNPVNAFVGILEILSEFIKIISFSFRLFGNIFAGELLLTIITSLTYGVATIPFLFLEIFIGFIQALVFFILVAMFMSLAVKPHSSEH